MRVVFKGLALIALLLAIVLPLASSNPDGLEATMEKVGLEENPLYHAPLNYGSTWGQGVLMGLLGITLAFGVSYGMARLFRGA